MFESVKYTPGRELWPALSRLAFSFWVVYCRISEPIKDHAEFISASFTLKE